MRDSTIARNYADALLTLARKANDPRGWGRLLATLATKKFLILSVFFMAISFFAFIKLVETADLSFAVPASAATIVFETILARLILKESVDARRWWGVCLVALGVILLAE